VPTLLRLSARRYRSSPIAAVALAPSFHDRGAPPPASSGTMLQPLLPRHRGTTQEIAVHLEATFAATAWGAAIAAGIAATFAVGPAAPHALPSSVHWRRRRVDVAAVGHAKASTLRAASLVAPTTGSAPLPPQAAAAASSSLQPHQLAPPSRAVTFVAETEAAEPFVAVVWSGQQCVDALVAGGAPAMSKRIESMRASLPPSTRLLLVVEGASKHLATLAQQVSAAAKLRRPIPPHLTVEGYETACLDLYLGCDVEMRETVSRAVTAPHRPLPSPRPRRQCGRAR